MLGDDLHEVQCHVGGELRLGGAVRAPAFDPRLVSGRELVLELGRRVVVDLRQPDPDPRGTPSCAGNASHLSASTRPDAWSADDDAVRVDVPLVLAGAVLARYALSISLSLAATMSASMSSSSVRCARQRCSLRWVCGGGRYLDTSNPSCSTGVGQDHGRGQRRGDRHSRRRDSAARPSKVARDPRRGTGHERRHIQHRPGACAPREGTATGPLAGPKCRGDDGRSVAQANDAATAQP